MDAETSAAAGFTCELANVVVTSNTGRRKINLRRLAMRCPAFSYEPDKFACATLKLARPSGKLLIFRTGKEVCTGSQHFTAAAAALNLCNAFLSTVLHGPVTYRGFKQHNIVGKGTVNGRSINVRLMYQLLSAICGYEPDLFPGLMMRTAAPYPKLVFLVFSSGKFIVTGAKIESEIRDTLPIVYHEILRHFCSDSPTPSAATINRIFDLHMHPSR
jgi:transcription initiation factor TFIID TATA-box-binding protein